HGTHTEWCITQKDTDSYFKDYHSRSPIIFYLPHPTAEDYKRDTTLTSFKFAAVEDDIWNEHDQTVHCDFPPCLSKLAQAVSDHYASQDECQAYLNQYGLCDMVLGTRPPKTNNSPFTPSPEPDDIDYDDFGQMRAVLHNDYT
ncbi:MAG: hypothetical protein CUN56_16240, partial [Phototrophicales bacterium]